MRKKQMKLNIIIVSIILIIVGAVIYYELVIKKEMFQEFKYFEEEVSSESNVEEKDENEIDKIENEAQPKIIVHVTGEVNNPGIIELSEESRVYDAIEAAGGFTENADTSKINLAYKIEDGMKITIPNFKDLNLNTYVSTDSGESVESSQQNNQISTTKNKKININTASQTELENLPGVGPALALKIIEYRNKNGKFKSKEDLKNVSGIGENKFNNLKEFVSL